MFPLNFPGFSKPFSLPAGDLPNEGGRVEAREDQGCEGFFLGFFYGNHGLTTNNG